MVCNQKEIARLNLDAFLLTVSRNQSYISSLTVSFAQECFAGNLINFPKPQIKTSAFGIG